MYEVWWPDDDHERLRARFRTLPDAIRFAIRADHGDDARLRDASGHWNPVSSYDLLRKSSPPERSTIDDGPQVDPVLLALEVMQRANLHDVDMVLTVVRETLDVITEGRRRRLEPNGLTGGRRPHG